MEQRHNNQIKLTQLFVESLLEIDVKAELLKVAKQKGLNQDQTKELFQAYSDLQQGNLDEGLAKKLAPIILSALMALPTTVLSQSQKQDLTKATQTTQATKARSGSKVDGIVGQFTSQYKFPLKAEDTITTVTKVNGQEISRIKTVKGKEHMSMITKAAEHGISKSQMVEWNKFVDWMKVRGYAGSPKMNNIDYSWSVIDEYAKEHPDFWIEDEEDVKAAQAALQGEREKAIQEWEQGLRDLRVGGKLRDPKSMEDRAAVDELFMPIVKPG